MEVAREPQAADGTRPGIRESLRWSEGYERIAEMATTMPDTAWPQVQVRGDIVADLSSLKSIDIDEQRSNRGAMAPDVKRASSEELALFLANTGGPEATPTQTVSAVTVWFKMTEVQATILNSVALATGRTWLRSRFISTMP